MGRPDRVHHHQDDLRCRRRRHARRLLRALNIHPETHQLRANEYIVTYRGILPEGVTATDPHILVYDEYTEVDGLVVPAHYTIYETDQSIYASCAFRDWSLTEAWDESWMEMPEGAVVDTTEP